jgi:hypothetical protein
MKSESIKRFNPDLIAMPAKGTAAMPTATVSIGAHYSVPMQKKLRREKNQSFSRELSKLSVRNELLCVLVKATLFDI